MMSKQSREASKRAKGQSRDDNGRFLQETAPNKRAAQKMPPVKVKRTPSRDNGRTDFHGLSAGEKRAQSKITFAPGDSNGRYQTMVRQTLRDSFTQDELRAMGDIKVEFGPVAYGNRAAFYRRYENEVAVVFDPKQIEEDDIVHEFTHALKAEDGSRTGYAATLHKRVGKGFDLRYFKKHKLDLSNIEEATVVAEATIRTKHPAKIPSGYFSEIPGVGKDPSKMKKAYDQDRLTLLDAPKGTKVRDTKGLQGKAAVNQLNKNFPKTNIAKKNVGGRSALTSYNRLKSNEK